MPTTYEDIKRVNATLPTMNIKGKEYVDVATRLHAFLKLYPEWSTDTTVEFYDPEKGIIITKTSVYDENGRLRASDIALEEQKSSMINRTSFAENSSTSSLGRAIGRLGIGTEKTICSADELTHALEAQDVLARTDAIKDEIIRMADGDRQRVENYVAQLWTNKTLNDLDYPTLVKLKADIAKKLAKPEASGMRVINIPKRES